MCCFISSIQLTVDVGSRLAFILICINIAVQIARGKTKSRGPTIVPTNNYRTTNRNDKELY